MVKLPIVRPKVAFSFLYGFFVLVFVLFMFFLFKQNEFKSKQSKIVEHKADYVFNFLNSEYSYAEEEATRMAKLIEFKLLLAFGGVTPELEKQLIELKERKVKTNEVALIIASCIEGRTFRNVGKFIPNSSDRNDFIIFLVNIIIGDLSKDCATDADLRSISEEVANQFNQALAYDAMKLLTSNITKRAFWHFTPLRKGKDKYYSAVLSVTHSNLDDLKEAFIKNNGDLNFLKHFEFLAASRIQNNDRDIFGTTILYPNGSINDKSLQLHILQGFNLLDAITLNTTVSEKLLDYDFELKELKSEFLVFEIFCAGFGFLIFVVFIFLLIIVDLSEQSYKKE